MYQRFKWTPVSEGRNELTHSYEPIQPFVLVNLAKEVGARSFLDVGANIGIYSILMSTVLNRIIAFEADKNTAAEVEKNARLNGIPIEVQAVAVSDKIGTANFSVHGPYKGSSGIAETSIHSRSGEIISVPTVTLDKWTQIEGPVCIKIDVEGHEPSVLRGASELFRSRDCLIQIECYPQVSDDVSSLLEMAGFVCLFALGPDHYYSNFSVPADAINRSLISACNELILQQKHLRKASSRHSETVHFPRKSNVRLQVRGPAAVKLRQLFGK